MPIQELPRVPGATERFRRNRGLVALTLCVLLGGLLEARGAGAQGQVSLSYPTANEDPDQGESQADATEPRGSLFPNARFPWASGLEELRRRAFEKYGLTFAASYQQLYQWASETAPFARFDEALGGWAAVSATWTPLDRGGPFEGTFVVRAAWRDSIGDHAVPAQFGLLDLGSLWSNYEFTSWNGHFRVEDLFWEQKFWGDTLSLRVGNQIPTSVFNFFRFKDARTSFTASPLAFHETIPYPTFGLGLSFRAQPLPRDPDFYVVGTLNDMNGEPAGNGLDWSTFGEGQYFYGLEIGKRWRRPNGEFDHLHVDVFYASDRSTRSPDTTPNKAGGGVKVSGEKQIGRFVGFASYTYNTAEGGGISTTVARHTAGVGVAYVRPFDIRGEVAIGGMWSQLIPDLVPGVDRSNQYGVEAYWHIGVTPNSSVTPGIQVIFNPVLNPTADVAVVPHIKFRIAF